MSIFIAETALVSSEAKISENTKIWHFSQIREFAVVGKSCIIAKSVYIDSGVTIGDKVKIQNNVSIFRGVTIEDNVFIGPHVCFANDLYPRSVTPELVLKSDSDWEVERTSIASGVSIGANSTILPGISIGKWALIGAGSLVSKNIPPYALAYGNPVQLKGVVAPDGKVISRVYSTGEYEWSGGKIVIETSP